MTKLIINILIITLLIFTYSCKDEISTITETGNGRIFIESNVEKGEIFLEGEFTGLYTPDTLELLAVNHLIKVRKTGYFSEERKISFKKNEIRNEYFELSENNLQKNVLIENFVYMDCDTCNSTSMLLYNLKAQYGEKLQIVNYPYYFKDPNNKFYNDVQYEVDNRLQFYDIIDVNETKVDGIFSPDIADYFVNRILIEPKLTISIVDTITQGNILVLSLFIDVFDLDEMDFNNLVLITAIIENDVLKSEEKSNIKSDFLLRSMFSNPQGISLHGITKKGRARFAVSEILLPEWRIENLIIISFVQYLTTKEVLQVGYKKLLLE